MGEVLFLKGISCSGKSTVSYKLKEKHKYEIISTDLIRKELNIGVDKTIKDIAKNEAYIRAEKMLKEGKSVILDCCNIGKHNKMIDLLSKTKTDAHIYWVVTHPNIWRKQAEERVLNKVIYTNIADALRVRREMYQALYYTKSTDFKKVTYIVKDIDINETYINKFIDFYNSNKDRFINNIRGFVNDAIGQNLIQEAFPELMAIMGYEQGNIHHNLTLDEHTFKVCDNLPKTEKWMWIGLLHDLGKVVEGIRQLNPDTGNNTYIGHAGASTDIGICVLNRFGFNQEFIDDVVMIVNRHMYLPYEGTLSRKTIKAMDNDLYENLLIFRKADMLAK